MLKYTKHQPKLNVNHNLYSIKIPWSENKIIDSRSTATVTLNFGLILPEGFIGVILGNKDMRAGISIDKISLQGTTIPLKIDIINTKDLPVNLKEGIFFCSLFLFPKIPLKTMSKNNSVPFRLIQVPNTDAKQTKTQINLLEMADLANISATSYTVHLEYQPDTLRCITLENRIGIDKKLYIRLNINTQRVMACLDNGSDLTLMQHDLFTRLFQHKNVLKPTGIKSIKTFSNNTVKILGQFQCSVKIDNNLPATDLVIMVIKNIDLSVPSFLFGNDSFRKCMATLSYTGNKNDPTPEFIVKQPIYQIVPVYQVSPVDLFRCTGNYSLKPFETTDIEIYLHPAAPVLKTHEIIVTSLNLDAVQFLPSKTDLTFDKNNDCYVGMACVCNLTNKTLEGKMVGRFEIINSENFLTYPIQEESKLNLLNLMKEKPPAREILNSAPGPYLYSYPFNISLVNTLDNNTPQFQNSTDQISHTDTNKKLSNSDEEILGLDKITYSGEAEISSKIIDTGLEVPTMIYKTAEEALNLDLFSPEIQPYIKKIFLEKYPSVVSLHSLDAGDVSRTLGFTTLRLIPGESLPRHKRIYQLSPQDARYLEQLLDQFIRFNYVRRAPIESTDLHLYGMSTYLVPRKKLTDIARLVIDFSPLTSIIQSPPSIVPDISASLQQLQGKALFSAMDLRYAYLALKIDEPSMSLTTFLTPNGAYQWKSIPTGAACSPAYFIDAVNRILHYKPILDSSGNPVYEANNRVKLERDVMPHSFHYFDDIVCSTELKQTYKETLDHHFYSLEQIIERLAFHNVKLSVNKSEFAKSKILFLGWIISHDFIIPDPRRMEKIKNAEFPKSKKEVRSFIGLVNSIRRVVPFEVIKQIQILTPLTSSSKLVEFSPTESHHNAFKYIKSLLLKEPLFCNLIKEKSTKYLWVDAASSSSCLGAVLAQQINPDENDKPFPTFIDLEDPVHRLIFDNNFPYQTCKIFTSLPITLPKPKDLKTVPPQITKKSALYGYTSENVHDSLFWSILSIYAVYNCKLPESTLVLRKMAVSVLKEGILGIKMKDKQFNNNGYEYRTFLDEFSRGKHNIDQNWYLVEALAKATFRCFIFLSSLEEHREKPIFKMNHESTKPPLIFGVYRHDNYIIFTPYFYNKNLEFNIGSLKNKIEIIAYLAKSVPDNYKSRSILDLEVFAILTALHSLQRYISNTKCHLLTDSRVLYYLFHQKVGDSSTKIRRWVLKLLSDYPLINLHFIRTTDNLADYLTRQGLPRGDLEKLSLKNLEIKDFYDALPKHDFTLKEWVKFCSDNPQYLTIV